jgi:hypothetical protein
VPFFCFFNALFLCLLHACFIARCHALLNDSCHTSFIYFYSFRSALCTLKILHKYIFTSLDLKCFCSTIKDMMFLNSGTGMAVFTFCVFCIQIHITSKFKNCEVVCRMFVTSKNVYLLLWHRCPKEQGIMDKLYFSVYLPELLRYVSWTSMLK